MKRLALVMIVVALASAANLWAAEEPAREGWGGGIVVKVGDNPVVLNAGGNPGEVVVRTTGNPGELIQTKSAADWYIQSIDKIVNLTDEQKKTITDIIETRDKSMKEFQAQSADKIKAAGNAMMEAYKSKDKDAISKAQKDYQELYAPMHQIMKKSQADLTNVLTAEQKAKLQESRLMSLVKGLTAPVQLSEEQIKQVKAAAGDLMKDDDPQGYMRGYGKLNELIQQILTPEQKATIAKTRAMSSIKFTFGAAKLTADQMEQVEAACDELVKDQTIKSEEVYKKLTETVDRLLTDEQKEALKKGRSGFWTVQPGQPGGAGGYVVQEVPERK
jgi:Spy/CpxP family protein refolding chaperone